MYAINGNLSKNIEKKKELKKLKENIYKDNFLNNYYIEGDIKKTIFYGIKWIVLIDLSTETTLLEFKNYILYIDLINKLMKELTFKEIINMFPIIKEFEGKRFESKDYFSTINWLENYNINEKVGENIYDFFFNFYNYDIMNYSIKELLIMDKIRKFNGNIGIMEEFLNTFAPEIDSYIINKELGYIQSRKTGKVQPLKKRKVKIKQKHIKIIK